MAESWNRRVAALIYDRAEIRQAHLEEALRHLRTAVPPLAVVDEGAPTAGLSWSRQPVHSSDPLGGVLWEFMTLAEATDDEIIQFARRYGPLSWPKARPGEQEQDSAGCAPQPVTPQDEETQDQSFAEPLQAWRWAARGLRALYDLVDPALPRDALNSDAWTWSIAPIAIPLWLADPDPAAVTLEEVLVSLAMGGPPGLGPDPEPEDVDWGDRLLTAALVAAGVDLAYQSGPTAGLHYTIPATLTNRADRHGTLLWQVRGLQPILMTSAAFAAQTEERPRCTRCGRPAAIIVRGPRQGRPWYGDHSWCRAMARAETMNKAEDRRAEKRKARTAPLPQVTN